MIKEVIGTNEIKVKKCWKFNFLKKFLFRIFTL